MRAYNCGVKGCSPTKVLHMARLWVKVLTQVQFLRAPFS